MENTIFYDLLRVALGNQNCLSKTPTEEEWTQLFDMAEKQAVDGITYDALAVLSKNGQKPSEGVIFDWLSYSEQIKKQNIIINQRCKEITKIFASAGFRSCILKGQGNAMMYPNPLLRVPGDIDVWLEGSKKDIVEFVHKQFPNMNVQYHHMNYPIFNDVEVEVHYYPSFCYNKWHNYRLQSFFRKKSSEQFQNVNVLGFPTPTIVFNLIFQLSHMMRHFFTQGIGIRHAIDYYYLLNQSINDEEKKETIKILGSCGMYKFFSGIMWIECNVLGLKMNSDIAIHNESAGRLILHEMMKGGNFGHLYNHNVNSVIFTYAYQMFYNLKYIFLFPSEPVSRPFALASDFVKKHIFKR